MQFFHSRLVEIADYYHSKTNDSNRALRWLAKHAGQADPGVAAEAALHMADRVRPRLGDRDGEYARDKFLEIFAVQEKRLLDVKQPHMAEFFAIEAAHSYDPELERVAKNLLPVIRTAKASLSF